MSHGRPERLFLRAESIITPSVRFRLKSETNTRHFSHWKKELKETHSPSTTCWKEDMLFWFKLRIMFRQLWNVKTPLKNNDLYVSRITKYVLLKVTVHFVSPTILHSSLIPPLSYSGEILDFWCNVFPPLSERIDT